MDPQDSVGQHGLRIALCASPADDAATFPVMAQLRPHLNPAEYPDRLALLREQGGRLVAAWLSGAVVGCAVYRREFRLHTGWMTYVDDLVSDQGMRSHGVGAALLAWIEADARDHGCAWCVLDSGVQRDRAHRFYFREGYVITSFNFKKRLD